MRRTFLFCLPVLLLIGVVLHPLPSTAQEEGSSKKEPNDRFFELYTQVGDRLEHDPMSDDDISQCLRLLDSIMDEYNIPKDFAYGIYFSYAYCQDKSNKPTIAADYYVRALKANDEELRTHMFLVNAAMQAGLTDLVKREAQWILNREEHKGLHKWAQRRLDNADWIGKAAVDFTLPDLDGNDIALKDTRDQTVILYFWASWAKTCRALQPQIEALAKRSRQTDNLVFIGINLDKNADIARAFAEQNDVSWRSCWPEGGRTGELSKSYGVDFIPLLVILDHEGNIRYREFPPDFMPTKTLDRLLEEEIPKEKE